MRHLAGFSRIVFLLTLFSFPVTGISHPLDVTYTTLVPQADFLDGKIYIHPFELGQLAESNALNIQIEEEFAGFPIILEQYFRNKFEVFSAGKKNELRDVQPEQKPLPEILADGIYLFFKIPRQENYEFKVSLFLEFSCTQSNKMILLNEAAKPAPGRPEIIFTKRRQSWILNPSQPDFSADFDDLADTDKDGLSDHLEYLFSTDASLADTDDDGFSDFEEIYMGWNPYYPKNVEGQRSMYLNQMTQLNSSYKSSPGFSDSARYYQTGEPVIRVPAPNPDSALPNLLDSGMVVMTFPVDHFISRIQYQIREQFNQTEILFTILFLFGLMHVFSFNFRQHQLFNPAADSGLPALSQILKFVLLHLSDVLATSLILLYLMQKFPAADWFRWFQVTCWFGLVGLAIFYLLNGLLQFRRRENHRHTARETRPEWIKILDQIDFLKPYSYRWFAFLFILSVGRIEILLSSLGIFGLGIFIAFLLVRRFAARHPHREVHSLGQLAAVISHLLLLVMVVSVIIPAIF